MGDKAYNFNGLTLQVESYTNKVGTSGGSRLVYLGPLSAILAAKGSLFFDGWQVTATNTQQGGENAIWQLEAVYQADLSQNTPPAAVQQPEPTWEIDSVTVDISIFELDRPFVKNLSADTKAKIERSLKNPGLNLPLVSSDNIDELFNATKLHALAQIGIESIPLYVPVLKRTITVPANFSDNYSSANKGKIFSKSKLVSFYGVPFYLQKDLPDNIPQQTSIDNNENNTLMAAYGYEEGPTRKLTVGANTIQISTNWMYGRFPVDLFDLV